MSDTPARCENGERGFSLILVTWGLTLLSLIAAALIAESSSSAQLTAARIGSVQASLLAESGVERALLSIDETARDRSWPENGTPFSWQFGSGFVALSIQDEGGKVDAFNAPDALLDAVLVGAGLNEGRRETVRRELRALIARSIVTNDRLETARLDDLSALTSLTAEEIDKLRPMLSVRNGLPGFDPLIASEATIRAVITDKAAADGFLEARAGSVQRADAASQPASPVPMFTQRSPRGAFAVHAEACTATGYLAVVDVMVRRDAPGKFVKLETRENAEARFFAGGCAPKPSTNS